MSILPRVSKNPAENRKAFVVTATPLSFCEFFQLAYMQHGKQFNYFKFLKNCHSDCVFVFYAVKVVVDYLACPCSQLHIYCA